MRCTSVISMPWWRYYVVIAGLVRGTQSSTRDSTHTGVVMHCFFFVTSPNKLLNKPMISDATTTVWRNYNTLSSPRTTKQPKRWHLFVLAYHLRMYSRLQRNYKYHHQHDMVMCWWLKRGLLRWMGCPLLPCRSLWRSAKESSIFVLEGTVTVPKQ